MTPVDRESQEWTHLIYIIIALIVLTEMTSLQWHRDCEADLKLDQRVDFHVLSAWAVIARDVTTKPSFHEKV